MSTARLTRRLVVIGWLCLVVAVIGYAVLVGLGPPPSLREPEAAAHWFGRFAVIWLVLWLLAAAAAAGAAVRQRRRDRRHGRSSGQRGEASGLGERHHCPVCGAQLVVRRARTGQHRGQPEWVCPEHGAV